MSDLQITSSAFDDKGEIPAEYTDDGDDVNPPLSISGVPDGAESLVLIIDDPDAPGTVWDHWILYNIDPSTTKIEKNSTPAGATVGKNDWGNTEYGGPAPPSGVHRYFFKLYALDTELDLQPGGTKEEVENAMEGHVLAEAELMGEYSR